jgi:hypothetical protein
VRRERQDAAALEEDSAGASSASEHVPVKLAFPENNTREKEKQSKGQCCILCPSYSWFLLRYRFVITPKVKVYALERSKTASASSWTK